MKKIGVQYGHGWAVVALWVGLAIAVRAADSSAAFEHQGFFWKVASPTATVYVLGSIHVGQPDFYPLRQAINAAYEASEVLAVEVDMRPSRQLAVMAAMMAYAMLPPDQVLRDSLPDDLRKALKAYVEQSGPGMGSALDRMTPWWAAISISMLEMQKAGLNPLWGIDLHFLTRAEQAGKPVIELEGAQQQGALFADMDLALQHLMLKQTLTELDKASEQIAVMMKAWKSGDAQALARWLDQSFAGQPEFTLLRKALFTDRDIAMTRRIRAFLDKAQTVFVVVGAGHVVGEQGIIARLAKDKTLTVTRL